MLRKINKRIARKLFDAGKPFIIVGDNVNTSHIISGWHCGCTVSSGDIADWNTHASNIGSATPFDDLVAQFEFSLERELGRRSAFYVQA